MWKGYQKRLLFQPMTVYYKNVSTQFNLLAQIEQVQDKFWFKSTMSHNLSKIQYNIRISQDHIQHASLNPTHNLLNINHHPPQSMAGVLYEAGTACPSRTLGFIPGIWWDPCCSFIYFSVLCVLLCFCFLSYVLCSQCYQFLWHGLSILDWPFGFL